MQAVGAIAKVAQARYRSETQDECETRSFTRTHGKGLNCRAHGGSLTLKVSENSVRSQGAATQNRSKIGSRGPRDAHTRFWGPLGGSRDALETPRERLEAPAGPSRSSLGRFLDGLGILRGTAKTGRGRLETTFWRSWCAMWRQRRFF